MSKGNSGSRGGIGFTGLLTILFVGLKLTGHLDWSWWWVLSPLWIAGLLAGVALVFLVWVEVSDAKKARTRKA